MWQVKTTSAPVPVPTTEPPDSPPAKVVIVHAPQSNQWRPPGWVPPVNPYQNQWAQQARSQFPTWGHAQSGHPARPAWKPMQQQRPWMNQRPQQAHQSQWPQTRPHHQPSWGPENRPSGNQRNPSNLQSWEQKAQRPILHQPTWPPGHQQAPPLSQDSPSPHGQSQWESHGHHPRKPNHQQMTYPTNSPHQRQIADHHQGHQRQSIPQARHDQQQKTQGQHRHHSDTNHHNHQAPRAQTQQQQYPTGKHPHQQPYSTSDVQQQYHQAEYKPATSRPPHSGQQPEQQHVPETHPVGHYHAEPPSHSIEYVTHFETHTRVLYTTTIQPEVPMRDYYVQTQLGPPETATSDPSVRVQKYLTNALHHPPHWPIEHFEHQTTSSVNRTVYQQTNQAPPPANNSPPHTPNVESSITPPPRSHDVRPPQTQPAYHSDPSKHHRPEHNAPYHYNTVKPHQQPLPPESRQSVHGPPPYTVGKHREVVPPHDAGRPPLNTRPPPHDIGHPPYEIGHAQHDLPTPGQHIPHPSPLPPQQHLLPPPKHMPPLPPVHPPQHLPPPSQGHPPPHMPPPSPGFALHQAVSQPGHAPHHMPPPTPVSPLHHAVPPPGHPPHYMPPQTPVSPLHHAVPPPGQPPHHMPPPTPVSPLHHAVPPPGQPPHHMPQPTPVSPLHHAVPPPGQPPYHMPPPTPVSPLHHAVPPPGHLPHHMTQPSPGTPLQHAEAPTLRHEAPPSQLWNSHGANTYSDPAIPTSVLEYGVTHPDGTITEEVYNLVATRVQRLISFSTNIIRRIVAYIVFDRNRRTFALRSKRSRDTCYAGLLDQDIIDSFVDVINKTKHVDFPHVEGNSKVFFFKEEEQILYSDVLREAGTFVAGSCGKDSFMFRISRVRNPETKIGNTIIPGAACPFGLPLRHNYYTVSKCSNGSCPFSYTCNSYYDVCCPDMPTTTSCFSFSLGQLCVTYMPGRRVIVD